MLLKIRFAIPLFCIVLAIAGCAPEKPEEGPSSDKTVFAGRAFRESVRISMSEKELSDGAGIFVGLWEDNDAVSVFDAAAGNALGVAGIISGQGSNAGEFSMDGSIGQTPVRLLYPATETYTGTRTLPSSQNQESAGVFRFKDCTFAYSDITGAAYSNVFSLTHAVSFIRVSIKAASSSDTYFGYNVHSLSFRVPGGTISGNFKVDYSTADVTPAGDNRDSVTVKLANAFEASTTAQDIWLAAIPYDCSGKQVLVTLELSKAGEKIFHTVEFEGKALVSNTVATLVIPELRKAVDPVNPDDEEFEYSTVYYREVDQEGNIGGEIYNTRNITIDGMKQMEKLQENTLDRWGGWKDVKPDYITSSNPEGFWRTGWYRNRPVMVDPDGNVAILHGVNTVSPIPHSSCANDTWNEIYNAKFSTDNAAWARWAGKVISEDFEMNFYSSNYSNFKRYRNYNGYGNSEDTDGPLLHPSGNVETSHCENLFFLRNFINDYYYLYPGEKVETGSERSRFVFMFDEKYLDFIDGHAAQAAEWFKNDRNFIGYYLDNELEFRFRYKDDPKTIWLRHFIDLPTEGKPAAYAAARKYARDFMTSHGVSPTQANITDALEDAFLEDVCEYYFRTAAEAIRRHDPNHLIMGCRLDGGMIPQEIIVKACAKYNDVVSFNSYQFYDCLSPGNHYFPPQTPVDVWTGNKPFLVSEFYTCASDASYNGRTYANGGEGLGWIVRNQEQRGMWYQNYCIKLLKLGYIVGWEWFQMNDEYNEAGWKNKGITSPEFTSYTCSQYFRQMHRNIYQVMEYWAGGGRTDDAGGAGSIPEGVWE